MNINSFSWSLSYDKTKVVPVTTVGKTDAPNSKLTTAAAIAPYFEIPGASKLVGYNIASFQIENTTAVSTGNYLLIGYAKNTGATIALDGATEVTMLKMTFRKIGAIDANTFNYFHKTAAGTAVSKLVYGTTNVLQYQTSTGAGIYTRPELFTTEILPSGYSISLTSLSAADLMNTGDTVYDDYMNLAGKTTVTIRNSYLAIEYLATTTVDPILKTASFSAMADRSYVISVTRNGYLIRDIAVTVAGANLELGDKSLDAGDIFADGIIDGSDSEFLFSAIGSGYGDVGYDPSFDLNLDGMLDGTDTEILLSNLGGIGYPIENVDYYN